MLSSSYLTINVPGFVPPRPSQTVFRSERSPSAFRVLLRLVIRQRSLVSLVARSSMGNTSSLTCISVDYAVSLVRPRRVIHAGLLVACTSSSSSPSTTLPNGPSYRGRRPVPSPTFPGSPWSTLPPSYLFARLSIEDVSSFLLRRAPRGR